MAPGAEQLEVGEIVAAAVAERDAMVDLEPIVRAAANAKTADSGCRIAVLSFSDWIGLLQTVVLVVTAWVALFGLRLTIWEHKRQRADRRTQPRRELILDVVHELKELATQVEIVVPGIGYFDTSAVAARKHRLRVALDFFPATELPRTRVAADPHDLTQASAQAAIAPAAAELAAELKRLEEAFTD